MAKKNFPWQTLGSQVQYENPWIRVTEHRVLNPANKPGIYGEVHMKSQAVGIIALDAQGYTYLVGQSRYVLKQYSWEIPEGGVPIGQSLLAGAQRELMEETGLSAQYWQPLMQLHTSNSVCDELAQVFFATGLTQGQAQPEETEDISIKRLPFEQALGMVMAGEITDAISVVALLRVERDLAAGQLRAREPTL